MQPDSVAVDAAGNLVISDGGNNAIRVAAARTGTFYGQAMTGGDIYTVAGDGTSGYFGDGGPATAAGLADPEGVAVSPAGNLLFADHDSYRVREVTGP
jgi:serine/threonine-protein kinase